MHRNDPSAGRLRHDARPQDYGTPSIGFRGRMGEDYGYGGYGHLGQSDIDHRGMAGDLASRARGLKHNPQQPQSTDPTRHVDNHAPARKPSV